MFCPGCGTRIPDGSRFCSSCGASLVDRPGGGSEASNLRQQQGGFVTTPAPEQKWDRGRRALVAALGIVAVVVVGAGVALALGLFSPKPYEGTVRVYSDAGDPDDGVSMTTEGDGLTLDISGRARVTGDREIGSETDDAVCYRLANPLVSDGSSDPQAAPDGYEVRAAMMVPKGATRDDLTGSWGFSLITLDQTGTGACTSITWEIRDDGTYILTGVNANVDRSQADRVDLASPNYDLASAEGSYTVEGNWERADDGSYVLMSPSPEQYSGNQVFSAS